MKGTIFSNGEIAVFHLGMAILNLTDLHHVGRPPFFLATHFWDFLVLRFFYRHGRIDVMQ